ncbi:MAG TPA: SRPBCC family protein [Acidobacteriaceae bacterium]|nr:SRPBCC family protein [Acidobacteriaceae bacterium]
MNQSSTERLQQSFADLPFGPKTLMLGAGALIAYGITRRSKAGTAIASVGGVLAYGAMRRISSEPQEVNSTFLVNASPEQCYSAWRNFENLPRFMAHLKSVRMLESNRSEWVAVGPMQREVRWKAETRGDQPGQGLSWASLPDSDIETSGWVHFRADPHGRGTFVTAEVRYSAPGGALGVAFATMMGKHPEFMVREDLRRFKALVECGEVPTTAGQTHGPRGMHGHTGQVLFRETSNHPEPQAQRAA